MAENFQSGNNDTDFGGPGGIGVQGRRFGICFPSSLLRTGSFCLLQMSYMSFRVSCRRGSGFSFGVATL